MEPHYIYDDSVSPPAQSLLQYSISPDTLWITQSDNNQTIVSLIFVALNNSSENVDCRFLIFGLPQGEASVGLSSVESTTTVPLTPDALNLPASSDQQQSWNDPAYQSGGDPDYPDYYLYKATPKSGGTLQPGQSLIFRIHNVQVVKSEGIPQVMIREMAGSNMVSGFLPVQILNDQQLQIASGSFQAAPGEPINPGDEAQLSWAIFNADHWKLFIDEIDDDALLYAGNQQSSQQLKPLQTTNYELIAYGDVAEKTFTTAYSSIMVNSVTLHAGINGEQSVTVDAQTQLTINWQTQLANRVKLHATDGTPDQIQDASSGSGSFQVTPTENVSYTVSAYYEDDTQSPPQASTPVTQELDVYINPARIISFSALPTGFVPGETLYFEWQTESVNYCTIVPLSETQQLAPQSSQQNPPVKDTPSGTKTYILTAYGQTEPTFPSTVNPLSTGWGKGAPLPDSPYGWPISPLLLCDSEDNIYLVDTQSAYTIFSSHLCASWNELSAKVPQLGGNSAGFVFNDGTGEKIYLMGGDNGWSSIFTCDPRTGEWTSFTPSATPLAGSTDKLLSRSGHACLVFNNKIWVIGGQIVDRNRGVVPTNDVWCSADGKHWDEVIASNPNSQFLGEGLMQFGAAVFNNQMWALGGLVLDLVNMDDPYAIYPGAWFTGDGINWQQWKDGNGNTSLPWYATSQVNNVASVGQYLWANAAGNNSPTPGMWFMDSSMTWRQSGDIMPKIIKTTAIASSKRVWLLGGYNYDVGGYNSDTNFYLPREPPS